MSCVSVIVPCYNYGHLLSECVNSVLSQRGVEVRVLILDDASPDDTPQVAAALAAQDGRVEYRRHAENIGHIATYNEGLAWADGAYTVLLSADDLLTPGALGRAVRLMERYPEVGVVYGSAITFTTKPPVARTPSDVCNWRIWNGLDWLEVACKVGHIYIRSPEVVVRTQLQRELGGYRQELPHTGDIEMWMRFAVHASVGEILDADQAYYRVHSANMHLRQFSHRLVDLQQRQAAFETIFREYGDCIPNREHLQKQVNRILAREALGAAASELDVRAKSAESIAEYVDFATRTCSTASITREYIGLRLRMLLGPRYFPLLRSARDIVLRRQMSRSTDRSQ